MPDKKFDLSVVMRVLDKASQPLIQIGRRFKDLAPSIERITKKTKALRESMVKMGTSLKNVGRNLSLKLTAPIVAFGALSLKSSMDFNKAMANVASLIPNSIKRVEELKKSVQDMSIRTGQSTDTMAEGLYQVISAFGDTSDTAGVLEINAKAAAAGLATVKDAVDLTSAVMKGYGDVSKTAAEKAADLAFMTVKLGQTTFPELAASIGRVTPLAAQLQVSQEELFNGFATLTGVTGGAAEVSTQMAGAMRALLKPTDTMKDALKYLGYESGKAMLKEKGLIGTFKQLFDITGGNEQILTEMFGRMEPLVAIFALLGPQAKTYTEKLEKMKKATGSMNEAFKEQTQGINKVGFLWSQLKVRLKILAQTMGDSLSPAFGKVIDKIAPFVDWIKKLDGPTLKAIAAVSAFAAVIGPVAITLGTIVGFFGASALAPIAAVTLAFVGLGAAIYQVTKNWEDLKLIWDDWSKFVQISNLTNLKQWGPKIDKFVAGPQKYGSSDQAYQGEQEKFSWMSKYQKSQTDVNIKVTSDPGTTATINKVKTKGDANVNVISEGYVGAMQ